MDFVLSISIFLPNFEASILVISYLSLLFYFQIFAISFCNLCQTFVICNCMLILSITSLLYLISSWNLQTLLLLWSSSPWIVSSSLVRGWVKTEPSHGLIDLGYLHDMLGLILFCSWFDKCMCILVANFMFMPSLLHSHWKMVLSCVSFLVLLDCAFSMIMVVLYQQVGCRSVVISVRNPNYLHSKLSRSDRKTNSS